MRLRNSLHDVFRDLAPNYYGVASKILGRRLQLSVKRNLGFLFLPPCVGHTFSVHGGPADATTHIPPMDALTALGNMEKVIGAAPGVAPKLIETHNPV